MATRRRANAPDTLTRALERYIFNGSTANQNKLIKMLEKEESRAVVQAAVNEDSVTNAFTLAANQNQTVLLQLFLDLGMNVDGIDQHKYTALLHACHRGRTDSVRILLNHNANVNAQCNQGFTSLMFAIQFDHTTIVDMLLQNNADPHLSSTGGWTALMSASHFGHRDIVQQLLNADVDINVKNLADNTALDVAATEEIKEMLRNHVTANYALK